MGEGILLKVRVAKEAVDTSRKILLLSTAASKKCPKSNWLKTATFILLTNWQFGQDSAGTARLSAGAAGLEPLLFRSLTHLTIISGCQLGPSLGLWPGHPPSPWL